MDGPRGSPKNTWTCNERSEPDSSGKESLRLAGMAPYHLWPTVLQMMYRLSRSALLCTMETKTTFYIMINWSDMVHQVLPSVICILITIRIIVVRIADCFCVFMIFNIYYWSAVIWVFDRIVVYGFIVAVKLFMFFPPLYWQTWTVLYCR